MKLQELIETLEYAPRMDTFAIKLVGGHIAEAELFVVEGNDRGKVENELAEKIINYIDGKQPIVRVLPEVIEVENELFKGRARIAVIPLINV